MDEVFADHGLDQHIAASAASIKDRIVAAELAYQDGKTAGIPPARLVATVNQLARQFNAPAYAYTDLAEVGRLRIRMLTLYPSLIGRGPAATRNDLQPHFEKNMAPIEAFHVVATLVHQKIFNPRFQMSAKERRAGRVSMIARTRVLGPPAAASQLRTQEMLAKIGSRAATMSFRDVLSQSEQALDTLGIPR
jgi:hypothetical protein